MSNSISALLTRNLHEVFGETIRCAGVWQSMRSSPNIACSMSPRVFIVVATCRSRKRPSRYSFRHINT